MHTTGATVRVPETSLATLFEAQAARTPDALALVFERERLTYAELNTMANRLAHRLIARGAGRETVVGIALPRSVDLVVGLFAVLKAGAAYLPIDPAHPAARTGLVLEDADPVVVLAQRDVDLGPWRDRALHDLTGGGPDTNPARAEHPDQAAYVIYTSGSTGRPKGAVVSQRSIVNRLAWMRHEYGLSVTDRVLQKTPHTFDVSVWEFFLPMTVGATLVVARPDGHRDPAYLAGLIEAERVTTVHFVPSMLRAFLADPAATGLGSLRLLVCSGEALPADLAARCAATLGIPPHNLYGPTEAAVDVTYWEWQPGSTTVPIGRPVWNTGAHVLDARLRPVPPGVDGELYLSGVQLARGYLNRPGLTACRFVADPAGRPGSRLYRTGDIARWTADGMLEYLGRVDDQVKIRGLRIELGEIESVLRTADGVTAAAVVAREDQPGDRRLVAYVVATRPDEAAWTAHLAHHLPEYMIPAAFVVLAELPLSTNGKLDRKALPAPEFTTSGQAPRTPRERVLAELCAEVLGLPSVGIDQSFFALGGDSVLAILLASRARRANVVITPQDVFTQQTVAGLAAVANDLDSVEAADPADSDGTGSVPLTPASSWLRDRGGPVDGLSQSVLVRVPAALTRERVEAALQAVIDHHDVLRMRLDRAGMTESYAPWSLSVPPPGAVRATDVLDVVDVSSVADLRGVVAVAAEQAFAGLSAETGVMVRAVWFDAGPDTAGRFLLCAHHLVVDGVSWRILLPDLAAAVAGQDLEPVGTSFRRWAELVNEHAQNAAVVGQLAGWLDVVDGIRTSWTERPLDPVKDTHATAGRRTVSLPAEVTRPLLTDRDARVNEILLGTLAIALARDGIDQVAVDLEGHGRDPVGGADLTRTVGWFTGIFPVRLTVAGAERAVEGGDALRVTVNGLRDQLRAVPDNGMGYGLLRHLNPQTSQVLAALPTGPVGFNYLGRFPAPTDQDWTAAPESDVLDRGAAAELPLAHVIDVDVMVRDGAAAPVLSATWTWANELVDENRVTRVVELWSRLLALFGQS